MKKISNQETEDFMTLPAKLEGSFRPYSWSLPPSTLELSSHDVHVWLTKLNLLTTQVQQMAQCLSENELIRAGRFHFKQDRLRFIVCRAVLRMILGRYLHIEPNRVQFSYGPYGKPYLEETVGDGTLQFNLGHSNDIALYAVTRCREIGVDIDHPRHIFSTLQITP